MKSGPRHFADIAGLRAAVGEDLGTGEWLVVGQDRIDAFAEATGDRQWIHVDAERARSGPYGATVAHGYLTVSLLPVLGRTAFTVGGARMSVNYGLDRVRFPEPVRSGARIRARAHLLSVEDVASGTRAVVRFTIEIEGRDRPACVADSIRLLVV
ncbi:MaoC family dehydratase [Nocardioides sp. LHD-245]|uniref:MaoC family dehydratase n=1 Tax=Nocardioides sp. LHD-245 TaxID=3051387 RepID=UPI0027DED88B|nr:MaoC family dehydratase [Nocardioides sp. LHD-245]